MKDDNCTVGIMGMGSLYPTHGENFLQRAFTHKLLERFIQDMKDIGPIMYSGKQVLCKYWLCGRTCSSADSVDELEKPPSYRVHDRVPDAVEPGTFFPCLVNLGKGDGRLPVPWRALLPTRRSKVLLQHLESCVSSKEKKDLLAQAEEEKALEACGDFVMKEKCRDHENCSYLHIARSYLRQYGRAMLCNKDPCEDVSSCFFAHPGVPGSGLMPPPYWEPSTKNGSVQWRCNDTKEVHKLHCSLLYEGSGLNKASAGEVEVCTDPLCALWERCDKLHVHPRMMHEAHCRRPLNKVFDALFKVEWFVRKAKERPCKGILLKRQDSTEREYWEGKLRRAHEKARGDGEKEQDFEGITVTPATVSSLTESSGVEDVFIVKVPEIHDFSELLSECATGNPHVLNNKVVLVPSPRGPQEAVEEHVEWVRKQVADCFRKTEGLKHQEADKDLLDIEVSQYVTLITTPNPEHLPVIMNAFRGLEVERDVEGEKVKQEVQAFLGLAPSKNGDGRHQAEEWQHCFMGDSSYVEDVFPRATGVVIWWGKEFPQEMTESDFWSSTAIVQESKRIKLSHSEALVLVVDSLQSAKNVERFVKSKDGFQEMRVVHRDWYIRKAPLWWARESVVRQFFREMSKAEIRRPQEAEIRRSQEAVIPELEEAEPLSRVTILKGKYIVRFKRPLDAVFAAMRIWKYHTGINKIVFENKT